MAEVKVAVAEVVAATPKEEASPVEGVKKNNKKVKKEKSAEGKEEKKAEVKENKKK